jgi:protein-disulfide isomerase
MTAPQLAQPVTERDHTLGPPNARVTLVEYGDFECPHCGQAFPLVLDALDRLGPRLRFVFRHYPITVSHANAQLAAEASEAAAAQGRFWDMHDRLFKHQDQLDRASLSEHARVLGLDVARFDVELDEGVYRDRVLEDVESGEASSVVWTPTFFINGVRYGYGANLSGFLGDLERAVATAR